MFFKIGVLKNFTNFIGKHQCWSIFRSSCSYVLFKEGILKNFTIFTEKHLCRSFFFKKRLLHRCFPVNIAKFLRTALFIEHFWWLHLYLLNKVAGLKTSNVIKKKLQLSCFPVKFVEVLRAPFFYRTSLVAASEQVQEIPVGNCVIKWCSG